MGAVSTGVPILAEAVADVLCLPSFPKGLRQVLSQIFGGGGGGEGGGDL